MSSSRAKPILPGAQSLAKLLDTGDYSDLTIICGKDRYKVHKAIVCPRSQFFKAAISGNFKEALTSEISLPKDDPVAVRMMVQYLYLDDYTPPELNGPQANAVLPSTERNDQSKKRKNDSGRASIRGRPMKRVTQEIQLSSEDSSPSDWIIRPTSSRGRPPVPPKRKSAVTPANLYLHTKVYELGERYGLQDLKEHAVKKFRAEAYYHHRSEQFRLAVHNVYTSTIDQDRSLRDAVVDIVAKHVNLLDNSSFQKTIKDTELGFDLLMHITRESRNKLAD
ncbi:hypothetical protein ACHAPA_004029 [Fusarium lateritium]